VIAASQYDELTPVRAACEFLPRISVSSRIHNYRVRFAIGRRSNGVTANLPAAITHRTRASSLRDDCGGFPLVRLFGHHNSRREQHDKTEDNPEWIVFHIGPLNDKKILPLIKTQSGSIRCDCAFAEVTAERKIAAFKIFALRWGNPH
jgi:hypothetical protein